MLIAPLYLLFLGISSTLAGVYGHRLLAALGFLPGFETGVVVAGGIACAFAAVQLAYVSFLRFAFPSRDGGPLFCEILSCCAAVWLVPILLDWEIPGLPEIPLPSAADIFVRIDNFVFLALFGVCHVFFKLMSLFGATRSKPSGRLGVLLWAGLCAAALFGAQYAFFDWRAAMFSPKILDAESVAKEIVDANDAYAEARPLVEGASLVYALEDQGDSGLTFHWAAPRATELGGPIYVAVELDGESIPESPFPLKVSAEGWAELRVPQNALSALTRTCTLRWSGDRETAWLAGMGFHAQARDGRALYVAGPYAHKPPAGTRVNGFVVVVVDGLGSEMVHLLGNRLALTPSLDAFAARSILFENIFSAAPESAAAAMTLFSGLSPLDHGTISTTPRSAPPSLATIAGELSAAGFATAAFAEGLPGEGSLRQGFAVFDTARTKEGAKHTLEKAADWIEAHRKDRYFVYIHLGEAGNPKMMEGYPSTFLPENGGRVGPEDVYNAALAYVDAQLGAFFERLDGIGVLGRDCVAVAGAYGLDYTGGRRSSPRNAAEARQLTERCLRIPLWLAAPGEFARRRSELATYERIAPTLLELSGRREQFNGIEVSRRTSLLWGSPDREAISMMGDPLALSMRTARWRFTWQSGRSPITGELTSDPAITAFADMYRYERGLPQQNYFSSESELAGNFRDRLRDYFKDHFPETAEGEGEGEAQ